MPQAITSPMPAVSIRNGMASVTPYTKRNTQGTINMFEKMGGSGAVHFNLLL